MGGSHSKHGKTKKQKGNKAERQQKKSRVFRKSEKKESSPEPEPKPEENNIIDQESESVSNHRPLPPVPPPLQEVQVERRKVKRALYDYAARTSEDLTFLKGDRLLLLGDEESNNYDWLLARNQRTQEEGYIPINYVVDDNDNPESQEWWFDFDHREADKQLLYPGNPSGTFLIRKAADNTSYALSVRDWDNNRQDDVIRHYKIRKKDDGKKVYISPRRVFDSLIELVEHYQSQADGLCHQLTTVCPKERPVVPFQELEVKRESITLMKMLGAGHFGEVWHGKWKNVVEVAVKTLKPGTMTPDKFLAEARIMHAVQHRHLVTLMAVCTTTEPFYIIMELLKEGALLDYLRRDEVRSSIKFTHLIDMAAQIASGMSYLEEKNYVHRDLRAANILVGNHSVVKIADFGLARITNTDDDGEFIYESSHETKFPVKWTAPEAAYERRFTVKSDVWSFGIVMYEMLTLGRVPYPGMSGHEALECVSNGYRMPKPNSDKFKIPDSGYDMLLKCWNNTPEDRPTFVFLYDFLSDYFTSTEPDYREM